MMWYFAAVVLATSVVTGSYSGIAIRNHFWKFRKVQSVQEGHFPPDQWLEQKLDHFDATNLGTWKQRYHMNDALFRVKKNGPVFLIIAGEGVADSSSVTMGAWITMYGRKYGALCFQLEHRFYGLSQPTTNTSTESLKYLSSEQALADLAYFIEAMNEKYGLSRDNRWISFGGSYAGSLSAWLRLKYPHLVHAAVSVSGPLLAVADFKQYGEVVEKTLASSSHDCVIQLKAAVNQFNELVSTKEGAEILNKKFNLCTPLNITNRDDIHMLASFLADKIEVIVQNNGDLRPSSVDEVCGILTNSSIGSPLDRYAKISNSSLKDTCLSYSYDDYIQELKKSDWNERSVSDRLWTYQTCVEFGFYQTYSTNKDLFGPMLKLPFFIKLCKDIFVDKFNEELLYAGINRTNMIYGGLDIEVRRVFFVQGSNDPWHPLGITKTLNPESPAIVVEGASHCPTMDEANAGDPPQVVSARNEIMNRIGFWLQNKEVEITSSHI